MNTLLRVGDENKITLAYLAGASIWVLLSDALLNLLIGDPALLNRFDFYNTWLVALCSAWVVYRLTQGEGDFLADDDAGEEEKLPAVPPSGEERIADRGSSEPRNALTEKMVRILRRAPAPMALVTGDNHVFEFVNDAYFKMMGYRKLEGLSLVTAFPELRDQGIIEKLDQVYRTGKSYSSRGGSVQVRHRGEIKTITRDVIYNPLTDGDGRVFGVFIQLNDLTKLESLKGELSEALMGKRVSLERMQRQFKNDFSLMRSLFELQSRDRNGEKDPERLLDISNARIGTLSRIYEMALDGEGVNDVSFHDFIHDHVKWVFSKFESRKPDFEILTSEVPLALERAVPLALIFNEISICLAVHHSELFSRLKIHTEECGDNCIRFAFRINCSNENALEGLRSPETGVESDLMDFLRNHVNAKLEISACEDYTQLLLTLNAGEEITSLEKVLKGFQIKLDHSRYDEGLLDFKSDDPFRFLKVSPKKFVGSR